MGEVIELRLDNSKAQDEVLRAAMAVLQIARSLDTPQLKRHLLSVAHGYLEALIEYDGGSKC